mgnify:CR=1 FL=1
MNYAEILTILAPCGLNCRKCMANAEGEIKLHSKCLLELLGPSFERYAQRFKSFMPVFEKYPEAKNLLEFFSTADCRGCRSGMCRYPSCGVMKCHKEKGVDFCFQCNDFPCDGSGLDPDLRKRWIQMNERMKEIGVESYYDETKDLCRYS